MNKTMYDISKRFSPVDIDNNLLATYKSFGISDDMKDEASKGKDELIVNLGLGNIFDTFYDNFKDKYSDKEDAKTAFLTSKGSLIRFGSESIFTNYFSNILDNKTDNKIEMKGIFCDLNASGRRAFYAVNDDGKKMYLNDFVKDAIGEAIVDARKDKVNDDICKHFGASSVDEVSDIAKAEFLKNYDEESNKFEVSIGRYDNTANDKVVFEIRDANAMDSKIYAYKEFDVRTDTNNDSKSIGLSRDDMSKYWGDFKEPTKAEIEIKSFKDRADYLSIFGHRNTLTLAVDTMGMAKALSMGEKYNGKYVTPVEVLVSGFQVLSSINLTSIAKLGIVKLVALSMGFKNQRDVEMYREFGTTDETKIEAARLAAFDVEHGYKTDFSAFDRAYSVDQLNINNNIEKTDFDKLVEKIKSVDDYVVNGEHLSDDCKDIIKAEIRGLERPEIDNISLEDIEKAVSYINDHQDNADFKSLSDKFEAIKGDIILNNADISDKAKEWISNEKINNSNNDIALPDDYKERKEIRNFLNEKGNEIGIKDIEPIIAKIDNADKADLIKTLDVSSEDAISKDKDVCSYLKNVLNDGHSKISLSEEQKIEVNNIINENERFEPFKDTIESSLKNVNINDISKATADDLRGKFIENAKGKIDKNEALTPNAKEWLNSEVSHTKNNISLKIEDIESIKKSDKIELNKSIENKLNSLENQAVIDVVKEVINNEITGDKDGSKKEALNGHIDKIGDEIIQSVKAQKPDIIEKFITNEIMKGVDFTKSAKGIEDRIDKNISSITADKNDSVAQDNKDKTLVNIFKNIDGDIQNKLDTLLPDTNDRETLGIVDDKGLLLTNEDDIISKLKDAEDPEKNNDAINNVTIKIKERFNGIEKSTLIDMTAVKDENGKVITDKDEKMLGNESLIIQEGDTAWSTIEKTQDKMISDYISGNYSDAVDLISKYGSLKEISVDDNGELKIDTSKYLSQDDAGNIRPIFKPIDDLSPSDIRNRIDSIVNRIVKIEKDNNGNEISREAKCEALGRIAKDTGLICVVFEKAAEVADGDGRYDYEDFVDTIYSQFNGVCLDLFEGAVINDGVIDFEATNKNVDLNKTDERDRTPIQSYADCVVAFTKAYNPPIDTKEKIIENIIATAAEKGDNSTTEKIMAVTKASTEIFEIFDKTYNGVDSDKDQNVEDKLQDLEKFYNEDDTKLDTEWDPKDPVD